MKQNYREKTVATMDLISLRLGEITDILYTGVPRNAIY